jgi:hypothetical protein
VVAVTGALLLAIVVALWVAAFAFGRDTRDGADRARGTDLRRPPSRPFDG